MVEPCELLQIAFHCEMTNNATMLVEITIGLIAATILSVFFYRRQEIQRKKMDEIITKQEELRRKRIDYLTQELSVYLYAAQTDINEIRQLRGRKDLTDRQESELVDRPITARIYLENVSRALENSFDILEPQLLKRIRNTIRAGLVFSQMGVFPDTDEDDTIYDYNSNWSKDIDDIIDILGDVQKKHS